MTVEPGLHAYLGEPRVGKTTRARADWLECARAHDLALLCIDSTGAKNLRDLEHAPDVASALSRLYTFRTEPVAVVPRTQADVDALLLGAMEPGRVAVLFDEFGFWSVTDPVLRALRSWYHHDLALFLVAHSLGMDMGERVLSAAPSLRIFRTTAPATLRYLMRWKGLDPDAIEAQATGAFVRVNF